MIYFIIEKLAVGVLGLGIVISELLTASTKPNTSAIPNGVEQQTITEQKIPTITESQNLWLKKLRDCESGNNPNAIGDNGLARGILQFHKKTFIEFADKYNLYSYAEKAEIENFYLNSDKQERLAILILTNEKKGWRHWYKCSLKIGLDKVDLTNR